VDLFASRDYYQILNRLLRLRGKDANPENAIKNLFDFVEQKGGLLPNQTKACFVTSLHKPLEGVFIVAKLVS
jgi:hypothetical protein